MVKLRGQTGNPPPWLIAGAAVVVVSGLSLLFSTLPLALKLLQLGVSLLLSWFLLQGSKTAWILALGIPIGQLLSSFLDDASWWATAAAVILLVLLCMPASVRYVWSSAGGRPRSRVESLIDETIALSYRGIAYMAQWESQPHETAVGNARLYGVVIWRLGIGLVFLLLLGGAIHVWQEGAGQGSAIVNVLAGITWTCYLVTQLAFIVAVSLAGYSHVLRRARERKASPRRAA